MWTDEEKAICILTYNRIKLEVLTLSTFCKNAVIPVVINILIFNFDTISEKDCVDMSQSLRAYL